MYYILLYMQGKEKDIKLPELCFLRKRGMVGLDLRHLFQPKQFYDEEKACAKLMCKFSYSFPNA